MHRMTKRFRIAAIAMALLSNACYTYGSTGIAPRADPETRVAAQLTTRAMADNEVRIGADIERVEGIVTEARGDSIEMRVLRTRNRGGDWVAWKGEVVAFGVNDFASFRERRFSRVRTAVGVAALASVVILALTTDLLGFAGPLSGSDPRPIPPGNPG